MIWLALLATAFVAGFTGILLILTRLSRRKELPMHVTDTQLDEINQRRREKGKPPLSRREVQKAHEEHGSDIDLTTILIATAAVSPMLMPAGLGAVAAASFDPPPAPSIDVGSPSPDGGSM